MLVMLEVQHSWLAVPQLPWRESGNRGFTYRAGMFLFGCEFSQECKDRTGIQLAITALSRAALAEDHFRIRRGGGDLYWHENRAVVPLSVAGVSL
jgi:hypothetical protein